VKWWTLTVEGRRTPFLQHVDDERAPETIRRTVERAKAEGLTVIVNVTTKRTRITVEEQHG
jgi:hypothetical protein